MGRPTPLPIHQDRQLIPMKRLAEVASGWHCDEDLAAQIARELLAERTTSYVYNARYKLRGEIEAWLQIGPPLSGHQQPHHHRAVRRGPRMKRYDINTITEEEKLARAAELDARCIFRAEVGSTSHGVTHGSNDIDQMAIYIPPLEELINYSTIGLAPEETFIFRPGLAANEPSPPGSLDRTYHSLPKFLRMLAKGTPSGLYALFGANQVVVPGIGHALLNTRGHWASKRLRDAYLGYMGEQRQRMTGERGAAGRIRRSPEGGGDVDWKYAMHMVRLGVQGIEYLRHGKISAPSLEIEMLLDIRSGNIPLNDVIDIAETLESVLLNEFDHLPTFPEYSDEDISRMCTEWIVTFMTVGLQGIFLDIAAVWGQ